MTTAETFQFCIFRQSLDQLELGYRAPEAFAILEKLETNTSAFVIGPDEVASYDWDKQTLTLTKAATLELVGIPAEKDAREDGATALMTMKERLGWENRLSSKLYTRAFVVKVAGAFLYGGIFLDALSQRAINYPVARISLESDQAVIAILPIQIPFCETDPAASGVMEPFHITDKAQADAQYLESQNGFFREWIGGMATDLLTQDLRALIRDERIKQCFAAGKLRGKGRP